MNIEQRKSTIATVYATVMRDMYGGAHDGTPKDLHYQFAEAVIEKRAYSLQHLANGMNDAAKAAFTLATGVSLPKTQWACWKAIRDWADVSDQADAVNAAAHTVDIKVKALRGRFSNLDEGRAWIKARLDCGFTNLTNPGGKWILANDKGEGFDLSKRGSGFSKLRPLIAAEIQLVEAKAALAEMKPEALKVG